jgi:hypothetical protein
MSKIPPSIYESAKGGQLGWKWNRGHLVPFSSDIGIGTFFSDMLMARIHRQKPTNMVICGEPGISKSYTGIELAEYLDPKFTEEQIVFSYSEYLKQTIELPEERTLLFDEPEYSAGHRSWMKEAQQALISTTRSSRFRVHPLIIPSISKSLLDIVIRKYLLQYMIYLEDRGRGIVYQIISSRFDESVFHKPLFDLYFEMLNSAVCDKGWCLSCEKFETCELLRAKYERKRKRIQMERYKEDLERTKFKESQIFTIQQLEELALKFKDKWVWSNRGKINVSSLGLLLEEEGINVGDSKVAVLARRLTLKYKEDED